MQSTPNPSSTPAAQSALLRMQSIRDSNSVPSPMAREGQREQSHHWADAAEEVDYSTIPIWPEDDDNQTEDSKGLNLFKVSEKTEKFLTNSFLTAVPNTVRRQWRKKLVSLTR